jgi:thiamine biosynthesis lipoprotein
MTAVREWEQWSTTCRLVVTTDDRLPEAAEIVDRVLADVDQACSRFRPDSELLTLVRDDDGWATLSPLLTDLMAAALEAAHYSDGAVDPTIGGTLIDLGYDRDIESVRTRTAPTVRVIRRPAGWRSLLLEARSDGHSRLWMPAGTQLDLGATAKAVASDRCAAAVAETLGIGVLVSLGGDIATAGTGPDGGWQVTVQDLPDDPAQQITLSDGAALATSSTARRTWRRDGVSMHHLVDPTTALPATGPWRSVTALAETCARANTLSTAALVHGNGAVAWLRRSGLPARLVSHNGSVATLNQWPREAAA